MDFKELKISLDDTYMNVTTFGTGRKNLLILSGISLCGLEGMGAGIAAAYSGFTDDYTVWVFDRKKVLPDGYTVGDMAEDIYRTCKELGISSAYVYGVSQGGMIGQSLAIMHPDFVLKLALCSTLCRATEQMIAFADECLELAEKADVVSLNRYFFKMVYSEAFLDMNKAALPALEKIGTAEDCKRFKVLVHACKAFDEYERTQQIKCPVIVIGDINDKIIGKNGICETADKLGCELKLYDKYSHAVYDEAAEVKQDLLRFFRG